MASDDITLRAFTVEVDPGLGAQCVGLEEVPSSGVLDRTFCHNHLANSSKMVASLSMAQLKLFQFVFNSFLWNNEQWSDKSS